MVDLDGIARRLAAATPGPWQRHGADVYSADGSRLFVGRDGSAELRYGVRLLRAQASVDRRAVQDLRREGGRHGAQLALLASPADLRGEARSEAQSNASPPVILWCGEALADRFLEGKTAVWTTPIELFEINDRFFVTAQAEAEEAHRRREDRVRERHRPEAAAAAVEATSAQDGEPTQPAEPPTEEPVQTALFESTASPTEVAAGSSAPQFEESDAEEESGEFEEGEEAPLTTADPESTARQGSERRRRRRRRRGRRGKGRPQAAAGSSPPEAPAPPPAAEAAPSVPDEKPNPPTASGSDEK